MSTLSPILDIAIGLAGVYIAFSLLASWLQEWIARLLNLRSKGLVSGIYQLFNGDTSAFTKFVQDPIFQALLTSGKRALPAPVAAAASGAAAAAQKTGAKVAALGAAIQNIETDPAAAMTTLAKIGPSYLSKEQFAAIFMNLIAQHGADRSVKAAAAMLQPPPPSDSASAGATAQSAAATPAALATQFAADVMGAANALGVGPQVNAILSQAGGDYDKFLASIENWYDDHMDRVTGWYKRASQRILMVIGLVIAVFFNVDSIRLYSGLSCNSALRGAVAIAAAKAAPGNAARPSPSPGSSPAASPQPQSQPDGTYITGMLNAVPIGWNRWQFYYDDKANRWVYPDDPIACQPAAASPLPDPPVYLISKLLGLIVTVVALSLGAPFWFDTLSRLTNVRAAGNKPDTSRKKS